MGRAIHQFVAGFGPGDAISNEARVMRDIFVSWGFDSRIFCERGHIAPELKKECWDIAAHEKSIQPDDIVLLHLSIGSNMNEIFRRITAKKAILYHNITPAQHFQYLNRDIAYHLEWGRKQIATLAGTTDINLADSGYNGQELEEAGFGKVAVLPLVLDLTKLDITPDKQVLKGYRDGKKNIVFVGRCAPNKAIEDLLHAFYYYQKYVEPNSRFIHVGSSGGVDEYRLLMHTLATDLKIEDWHFVGSVPQKSLNAYYQIADVFLCTSEHEGFGIPLIEAMYMDAPVLAYDSSAVSETMDGAGVLFKNKDWAEVAEMMGQLTHNDALRDAVLQGQRERMKRYQSRDLAAELKQHFAPLL